MSTPIPSLLRVLLTKSSILNSSWNPMSCLLRTENVVLLVCAKQGLESCRGYALLSSFHVSSTNRHRYIQTFAWSWHCSRSSGTGSSGTDFPRFSAHVVKLLTATQVLASVFAGFNPSDAFSRVCLSTGTANRLLDSASGVFFLDNWRLRCWHFVEGPTTQSLLFLSEVGSFSLPNSRSWFLPLLIQLPIPRSKPGLYSYSKSHFQGRRRLGEMICWVEFFWKAIFRAHKTRNISLSIAQI